MGVRGLMSYMIVNKQLFLRKFDLHDSYLVIDGNSLASQLYIQGVKCNYCFGGDYDKYANYVSNFFDDLLKCNITPIIIIDGAIEDKKISTSYKRMKEKINVACIEHPEKQVRTSLLPVLHMNVFTYVAKKKNLKLVQCILEADTHVASLAKFLNCPVLSADSDFFIFDVMFIPFNTLYYGTVRNGDKFVKKCEIYKLDYFVKLYPGMDKSLIPVAAVVLGNDYIDKKTFESFLSTLKMNKRKTIIKRNEYQQQIDAIFTWLQNETLDSAITNILNKIKTDNSKNIVEDIEMVINGYFYVTPIMLSSLGFSRTFLESLEIVQVLSYKFGQGIKIKKINPIHDFSCDSMTEKIDILSKDESNLRKIVPEKFLKAYLTGNLRSYFFDIIKNQFHMCSVQVENFSQPTCIFISHKIISVIFNLLRSTNMLVSEPVLECVQRGKSMNIVTYKLKCENPLDIGLPTLLELPNLSHLEKKEIINQTLGVIDGLLDNFPLEWKLYMATIKYWLNEAKSEFCTKYHLYALIFSMLFHIVDQKVGFFCRKRENFEKKFNSTINQLIQNRKIIIKPLTDMTINDAISNVNREDCILAMPFFLSNFNIDKVIVKIPKRFNISIVHAFSLFQNCIKYVLGLNALLEFPYEETNIAKLFNGTLLYNIYNKFKCHGNIDNYIRTVLQNSPSLLQLFYSILISIKSLCPKDYNIEINNVNQVNNSNVTGSTVICNKVNTKKQGKPRKKNILKNNCSYVESMDSEKSVPYCDYNNKFNLLNINN